MVRVCLDLEGPHVLIWRVRLMLSPRNDASVDLIVLRHSADERNTICASPAAAVELAEQRLRSEE